jgi:hypothetical protein
MSNQMSIVRHSGLINIREHEGRPVHLVADLAEALQVDPARVRQAFKRNIEDWNPGETGVCHFDTPSGLQESRWFSHRGAMRFCRCIKSGRADALFNHLLDLWEGYRGTAQVQVADDRIAVYLDQIVPAVAGRINEISARVETHAVKQIVDHCVGSEPDQRADLRAWKAWDRNRKENFAMVNRIAKKAAGNRPRNAIRDPRHAHAALSAIYDHMRGLGMTPSPLPELVDRPIQKHIGSVIDIASRNGQ